MSGYSGIVVSSRIRFARNVRGFRFPAELRDSDESRTIINLVFSSLSKYGKFEFLKMSETDPMRKESLKERYVISDALIRSKNGAVAYSSSQDISVMINEEDHLREQCIVRGGELKVAYTRLSRLDNWLDANLHFCKNKKLGYITACPTNLGTGMRASTMLFLPGHVRCGKMDMLEEAAAARNLTVRGAFGEGSDGDDYFYQISNEVTLGRRETSMIDNVVEFVNEVAEAEQEYEQAYYRASELRVEDEIFRSLGTLLYCRRLSYEELSRSLSDIKLGAILGFIKVKRIEILDDLLVSARPCRLVELEGDNKIGYTDPDYRDELRARFVRESIKELVVD